MSEDIPQGGFTIVGGNPSDAEIAAVTGVLSAALEEIAGSKDRAEVPAVSAWQRGQRGLRGPLRPAPGAWRHFSG